MKNNKFYEVIKDQLSVEDLLESNFFNNFWSPLDFHGIQDAVYVKNVSCPIISDEKNPDGLPAHLLISGEIGSCDACHGLLNIIGITSHIMRMDEFTSARMLMKYFKIKISAEKLYECFFHEDTVLELE